MNDVNIYIISLIILFKQIQIIFFFFFLLKNINKYQIWLLKEQLLNLNLNT
jgi:hypothetical protein